MEAAERPTEMQNEDFQKLNEAVWVDPCKHVPTTAKGRPNKKRKKETGQRNS
jgi:hypothetical protein